MRKILALVTILLAVLLTGCNLSAAEEQAAPSPEALFTSAAQTAEAMGQQRFGLTPSPPAAEAMIATAAAVTPTFTEAAPPITTTVAAPALPVDPGAAPTAVPTDAAAPGSAAATGGDKAEYVADVTIPDGTGFYPGETFEKTWRIANTGTTTWSSDYELVFVDGDLLGAPDAVSIPNEVKPGEKVEITVQMTAPEQNKSFVSYWKMRTPDGKLFGFGSTGTEAIWVKITVSDDGSGSATESAGSGGVITGVSLSVDDNDITGSCPHTFLFTVQVALSKASPVTFALEAGSMTGGDVFTPSSTTRNLSAGSHSLVFDITIPSDMSAWARLHVTQPEEALSNQVNFALACQ